MRNKWYAGGWTTISNNNPFQFPVTTLRINFPRSGSRHYMSRSSKKATNLVLTVITVFMLTNLPYMIDEFMRQEILSKSWYCLQPLIIPLNSHWRCSEAWCETLSAVIGVSIVSNSCINPFIFLFFNSDNPMATSCLPNRSSSDYRLTRRNWRGDFWLKGFQVNL